MAAGVMSLSAEYRSLGVLLLLFACKCVHLNRKLAGYWLNLWPGKLQLHGVFVFVCTFEAINERQRGVIKLFSGTH